MSDALNGKVAIVTGAGRGIGAAAARLLAKRGTRVVLAARTEKEIAAVASEIGENARAVVADVGVEADVLRLFDEAQKRFGTVDILINNAGILRNVRIDVLRLDDWEETLRVNLTGAFLCAREAFRRMSGGGRIVNVSSLSGIRGVEKFPGYAAYVASKFGLVGLTEVLAVEGAERGIGVNAVAPGAVMTEMLKRADSRLSSATRPEDIAPQIVRLADASATPGMTGEIVEIHCNA